MKKLITFFLAILLASGVLVSCNNTESTNELTNESTAEETINNDQENDAQDGSIFNTQNIKRITFYAYYGYGKGSNVPAEKMAEYTTWLGTFSVGEVFDDIPLPPGTNTYHVEIEYLDGTIVKKGLDITTVDGVGYHIIHGKYPDSFWDIISKASLE